MKLKSGLLLRQVAGENVVLSAGSEVNLNGMLTLNDTGVTLWKCLEKGAELPELVAALLSEYEVDEATATAHTEIFVNKLKELNLFV